MATGDLLVRGGTVVDGTGAASFEADVRVRSGKIAEVGPGLRPDGEPEIDAGGALVTPGFIEPHTHYDGSLWWDPHIDPMPSHGTTSVVLANCGLGLAPLREADRDQLIELMCFIEDLPTDAFETAIPWTWETWPEYQAANDEHPTALNVAAFFPHQTLRMWVMGAEAWERAATEAERAEMAHLLDEGLAAGAFGLSTSLMDLDRHNRLVPSRMADDQEWGDLLDVVAAHPGATFQFVPRAFEFEHFPGDMERMAALCRDRGVRANWGGFFAQENRAKEREISLELVDRLNAEGSQIATLYSVRPGYVNLHFERSIMWSGVEAWHELCNVDGDEAKLAMLRDDAWRERARHDWDACTYTLAPINRPHMILLASDEPRNAEWTGRSIAELADARGVHLSDAVADWLLDNNMGTHLKTQPQPVAYETLAEMARSPHTVNGGSDAGAHIQMFVGAGDATFFLTEMVREQGLLSVEEAVHTVTGKQAAFFGLQGRGMVAEGAAADLAVFALDEIDLGDEVRVNDLPAGSWRYSRKPAGYRATVVNGVPTWADGDPTAALPGRFLRNAAAG